MRAGIVSDMARWLNSSYETTGPRFPTSLIPGFRVPKQDLLCGRHFRATAYR